VAQPEGEQGMAIPMTIIAAFFTCLRPHLGKPVPRSAPVSSLAACEEPWPSSCSWRVRWTRAVCSSDSSLAPECWLCVSPGFATVRLVLLTEPH
jgi:hypothetical protein